MKHRLSLLVRLVVFLIVLLPGPVSLGDGLEDGQLAFESGDYRRAISIYQSALQSNPNDAELLAELLAGLAKSYEYSGREKHARINALAAIAVDDRATEALLVLGRLSNLSQDWSSAIDWFNRVIAFSEDNVEAYAGLSEAYTQVGEFAAAEEATTKLNAFFEDDPLSDEER